jgi:hypothetical protein
VLAAGSLGHHFTSGMDTTFTMAYLMLYLLLAAEFERAPGRGKAILLGACGGLAFLARPDLLLFMFLVPAALVVSSGDADRRRWGLLAGVLSASAVGVQMLACWRFLHSPLPLPFYAKSMRLYDAHIYGVYRTTPLFQLLEFGQENILPIAVVAAGALLSLRSFWKDLSAVDRGILVASLLHVSYYLFFVLQIVGGWQRFYYPVLPALLYLACRCLSRVGQDFAFTPESLLPRRRATMFVLVVGILCLAPSLREARGDLRIARRDNTFGVLDLHPLARGPLQGLWIGLEEISTFPDDLVIATTEVGLPGAWNLNKTVVDMAGLQETSYAHAPFTAALLLARYHPDVIYMPHPDYQRMTQDLLTDPTFIREYELLPAESYRAQSGIALRRGGPHYQDLRRVLSAIPPFPDTAR